MKLADKIELACLMEATARKPGNVHPGASFVDLRYDYFVAGAAAIASVLVMRASYGLGTSVFEAIAATQQQAKTNINLGIVLLLAPLTAVPHEQALFAGLPKILQNTTQRDAADVYRAIRLAHPGGLGKVDNQDVADEPTQTLLEVMQLAADRDLIAAQYSSGFALVRTLAMRIAEKVQRKRWQSPQPFSSGPLMPLWEALVIETFLELLAEHPDSLIVRKAGMDVAREAQRRAAVVIENQWPHQSAGWQAFRELDDWLRADGHRRNPGTSADLMAAALFVVLREGWIEPPTKAELQAHAAAIRAG